MPQVTYRKAKKSNALIEVSRVEVWGCVHRSRRGNVNVARRCGVHYEPPNAEGFIYRRLGPIAKEAVKCCKYGMTVRGFVESRDLQCHASKPNHGFVRAREVVAKPALSELVANDLEILV